MSLETSIAALVEASNKLTDAVNGKIGEIDQRVASAENEFDQWRGSVEAKDISGESLYRSTIDLTGLSSDYYYPVWWRMPNNLAGESRVMISRNYAEDRDKFPFGPGVTHLAGLLLQIEGTAHQWDGDANYMTIKRISQTYRDTVRAVKFAMMSIARPVDGVKPLYNGYTAGQVVGCDLFSGCYLRGGLTYHVAKNFKDGLLYSRQDVEVELERSVQTSFEIKWMVKPYHKDDATLGAVYAESRLAYILDYDSRYAKKA
ncbi:hypothetical protein AAGU53_18420 (plasmid) [Edwardsiella ictaluri]|uniref:hypothetical protein n=1 Tax=Edwardsiella ictaluri TaxID=67780 RepID=UPI0018DE480C|nr:hypothetical protein [Edwardsiella ictaluri]QPW31830.1 hypothetical protein F8539_18035 [Edwardsiella ictaluri]